MAPLPQNNTHRFFLDYDTGGYQHTLSVRYAGSGDGYNAVMTWVDSMLDTLNSNLYPWTVVNARVQLQGEDLSFPVGWTGNSSYGSGVQPVHIRAWECRFLQRSFDGRRTSLSIYGTKFDPSAGFRRSTAADTTVNAVHTILFAAAGEGLWVTISGGTGIVYNYADFNFNSYWEEQIRLS